MSDVLARIGQHRADRLTHRDHGSRIGRAPQTRVGHRTEERIVTIGQPVDDLVEIATGLKAGENVATSNVEKLSDGARVTTQR